MDVPFAGSALRRVTEVPDPSGVVLLRCWRSELTLFSSLHPPLGQASLTRAVLLLRLRFYSHLIPLWGVRYTSPSGGRLLSGFGGGVCFLLGGLHHNRTMLVLVQQEYRYKN